MERRLILIRHAKSDYPWGVDDHYRPLNGRGRRDAPVIGDWLMDHVSVDRTPLVVVSTATRTQLTWRLIRERLSEDWAHVDVVDEPRIYEAQVSVLNEIIAALPDERSTVIVIGHNPGLRDFLEQNVQPGTLRDQAITKFPTSAIAMLSTSQEWGNAIGSPMIMEQFAIARGSKPE
jgi:phosphohistidine phosphatase